MLRKFLLSLLLFWCLPLAAAPKVVVSIAPVHSLVAGVMDGVAAPQLLIPPGSSPHAYALKPSDARALADAQLVIWVGEGLEPMLEKPLHALAGSARTVELAEVDGISLLDSREGGIWGEHYHGDEHHDDEDAGHDHGEVDMHLWLSPTNARVIVSTAAAALIELDGANAQRYRDNAATMVSRIDTLESSLRMKLKSLGKTPYIVFHDAYHYYEEAFGLNPAGAISVSPERSPGAKRISEIRQTIQERKAACVFSEPQFQPRIVKVVLEGSGAGHGVLDPLGSKYPLGKDQWFGMMSGLAGALTDCLIEAND